MAGALTESPAAHGFVMPAEWERHSRCWMAWPCRDELWGERIGQAQLAYADVAKAIAEFEPVTMICNPADVAEVSLATAGTAVEVLSRVIDDSWVRDTGPTFLVDREGHLGGVDWNFNGWGGKYQDIEHDANLAKRLLRHVGAQRFKSRLVMEGGALHVDGEGTGLTTAQCVLNPNRNPWLTREAADQYFRDYLGLEKMIWLERGLEDDETDGHIDEIACFVRPGVVLALVATDKADPNHPILQANLDVLKAATDAKGRPLQVIEVPQPAKRIMGPHGRRLTMSYVNLYIANGGVIVPTFEQAEDDRAFRIIRDAFPDRRAVQVEANDIVLGGGGIHCITHEQPEP